MASNTYDNAKILLADVKEEFQGQKRRKFAAGLLISLIDFMLDLETPKYGFQKSDDFYAKFPR